MFRHAQRHLEWLVVAEIRTLAFFYLLMSGVDAGEHLLFRVNIQADFPAQTMVMERAVVGKTYCVFLCFFFE